MMLKQIITTQKKDLLDIRWDPNNICNFKCRYCFPGCNTGEYQSPSNLDLVLDNFSYLINKAKRKKVKLTIGGGEPTLWKNIGVFIKAIKEKHNVYVTLITNGSRTVRWWKEYGDYIDDVHISFHLQDADINHTIEVADVMYSKGKKTTVKVLLDPLKWDDAVSAVETMKKKSKFPWFITVAKLVGDYRYTKNQEEYFLKDLKRIPNIFWFIKNIKLIFNGLIRRYESVSIYQDGSSKKSSTYEYINSDQMFFKGWKCNIGVESVYIAPNGYIGGACGQRLSGNILSPTFKNDLILGPVICEQNKCLCVPETHISKINFS